MACNLSGPAWRKGHEPAQRRSNKSSSHKLRDNDWRQGGALLDRFLPPSTVNPWDGSLTSGFGAGLLQFSPLNPFFLFLPIKRYVFAPRSERTGSQGPGSAPLNQQELARGQDSGLREGAPARPANFVASEALIGWLRRRGGVDVWATLLLLHAHEIWGMVCMRRKRTTRTRKCDMI